MSRDLGQLLDDTATVPSAAPDPAALIARGRRRRRLRRGALGGAAVAGALAVAMLVSPPAGQPAPQVIFDAPPPTDSGGSQTAEEAARDGVVPELAALPFEKRVRPLEHDGANRLVTDEGVWLVSRLDPGTADPSHGCGMGAVDDPGALYRRDVICDVEYGEVLLLDHAEQRILRAYPLPGLPPQRLLATDEAVYCARQGDGGLPDSMLCRIDRRTGDWLARVFPWPSSEWHPPPPGDYVPDHWTIDEPVDEPLFSSLEVVDGALVLGGRVVVDPETLELDEQAAPEEA